jgi:hypothetical protein
MIMTHRTTILFVMMLWKITSPAYAQPGKTIRISQVNRSIALGSPIRLHVVFINQDNESWHFTEPAKTWHVMLAIRGPDGRIEELPFGPAFLHVQSGENHSYYLEPKLKDISLAPHQRYFFDYDIGRRWLEKFQPGRSQVYVYYQRRPIDTDILSNTLPLTILFTHQSVEYLIAILRSRSTHSDQRRYGRSWLVRFKSDFTMRLHPETAEEWAENQKAIDDFAAWWKKHRHTPRVAQIIREINEAAKHVPPYVPPIPEDVVRRLDSSEHPCENTHHMSAPDPLPKLLPAPTPSDSGGNGDGGGAAALHNEIQIALFVPADNAPPLRCVDAFDDVIPSAEHLPDAVLGRSIGLRLGYLNRTQTRWTFLDPCQTCTTKLRIQDARGGIQEVSFGDDFHQAFVVPNDQAYEREPTRYTRHREDQTFVCDLWRRWPETFGPGTYTLRVVDEGTPAHRISNPVTLHITLTQASVDRLLVLLNERFVTVTGRRYAATWLAKFKPDFALIVDPQTPADQASNRNAIDAFATWWKTHRMSPAVAQILAEINAPGPEP